MRRLSVMTPQIRELLKLNRKEKLSEIVREVHPVDIADVLFNLDIKEQVALISRIDKKKTIEVFNELDENEQFELLDKLEKELSAYLLNEMSSDERADLLNSLPDDIANRFLNLMSETERKDVEKLLKYPPNSAGSIMTTEYISLTPELTASQASELIRQAAPKKETIYYTYVTDRQNRLIGFVSLKDIFMAKEDVSIKKIMHRKVIKANILQDQEEVAKVVRKYNLLAIPVIDKDKKLSGIITIDDVVNIVVEEDTEDILHYGAISGHIDYMGSGPFHIAKQRILWLLLLVVVGFLSGWVMERYALQLQTVVALVFFIPLLMGTGGNAGTQSSTVVIRGLATGEINMKDVIKVFKKEFFTGLLIGIAMGVLATARAMIMHRSPLLGVTVGMAMVVTVMLATSLGAVLPLLFKKLKLDPALMSAPFITSIVDVVSIFIYLQIAMWVFR